MSEKPAALALKESKSGERVKGRFHGRCDSCRLRRTPNVKHCTIKKLDNRMATGG